jgi:hypothetical protein
VGRGEGEEDLTQLSAQQQTTREAGTSPDGAAVLRATRQWGPMPIRPASSIRTREPGAGSYRFLQSDTSLQRKVGPRDHINVVGAQD